MEYDVIIIGGGPGGSSAAIYLRQKGYTVVLFEKEIFPRDHVGESLIPFTYFHLKAMGVLDDLIPFTTKKPGVNFVDKDGIRQSVWCFDRIMKDGAEMSMHTLRAPFDHVLLKRASTLGAEVYEGATVKDVDLSNPTAAVVIVEHQNGKREEVRAKFLIDASGQHSFVASKLGTRTPYKGLDRIALFSHWVETKYDDALSRGLIKIVYLGGEKIGWLWVIPVGRNHLSIGVTLNNSYVREEKKKLGENWKEELYRQEVREAIGLRGVLEGAKIEHAVQVMGDYSFNVEKKFGTNYAHVGDAGAFLDPIFSSGIYIAMEVAQRTANCIDIQLKAGIAKGQLAFAEDFKKIDGAYKLIEKFVRLFYDETLLNFSHANVNNDGYQRFLNAYEIFHYLMAGDFFTEYNKYEDFIDQLRKERSFNNFINYVKTKAAEFPAPEYCRYSFDDVYGHLPAGDQVGSGLLKQADIKTS